MKNYIIILILFLIVKIVSSQSITVDGLERTYIIHLPVNADKQKSMPLVFVLHGGGGEAKGMVKLTDFNDVSDKNGFVVVYPDGIDKRWNDGRADFPMNENISDVKFISSLIDTLKSLYKIDSNKIFSTGISNGAAMSFRLACELSDKIAAIAPVANSMTKSPSFECKTSHPMPVMLIFGEDDPIVPFEGGDIKILGTGSRGKVIPVIDCVNYWVKFNACNTVPVESTLNEVSDGTEVVKKFYKSSDGKGDVAYWLVKNGGHTWPGGPQYLPQIIIGKTCREFNASEEIWKFFSDKTLN